MAAATCSEEEAKPVLDVPLLAEDDDSRGGFRTLPFIIGNEALEKMATYGLMPNMTLYLMNEYHMEMSTASTVLFLWSALTNLMSLVGAILADSFLGRFYTIGFGSIICLLGMVLLWSTTVIPQAKPPPCDVFSATCIAPTMFQFVYLCISFVFISIGAGGIRSCSLAFGVDQLEKGVGFWKNPGVKERYFGWYYACYTVSVLIALTCVVYIQDNLGWGIGFAVPTVLMMFGSISFFLASPFYMKLKSKTSLVIGFIQVTVASYRNRHLKLYESMNYVWHCETGSTRVFPTRKLSFLNTACIVKDPELDLTDDGKAKNPWTLCTVDQVEDLKKLIRVLPIWSTGIIMAINISQNSFPLLQAVSMDRHVTPSFTIPAASFSVFIVISVILWVVLYDRIFLPLASKLKGRRVVVSTKMRMGLGIFFSCISMLVAAAVEGIRRYLAIKESLLGRMEFIPNMSALWLVPQNILSGFAEASNAIAQNEFYFSELPRSMSSIATVLLGLGMALANVLASFILNTVHGLSKVGGNPSWISSDINTGHYDYYYLVLAGLSAANMIYYTICSKAYGPLQEAQKSGEDPEEY